MAREPNWPHSAEEDYIVFRFGRDGAFDVVKPRAALASEHRGDRVVGDSLPPTGRRKEVSDGVAVEDYSEESHENSEDDDGYDSDDDDYSEVEEVNTGYIDSDSSTTNREDNKSEGSRGRTVLPESVVGSNRSDDSTTSSFAFPKLRWEWVGSPIKMPRPQKSRLRKIKSRCATCSICC